MKLSSDARARSLTEMKLSAHKSEGWLLNKRGQRLYTASFIPPKGPPTALLFFHHGLGEHISRYDKVFGRMSEHGIAVHVFDAHGHGKSGPPAPRERAYVSKFQHLVDDLYLYVDSVVNQPFSQGLEHVPLFLGGQSMGGLVAAHAALQRPDGWSGILLHSPALDVEWTTVLRVQANVGDLLSRLVPAARLIPAVRPEDMSQDPVVVKDFLSDPLITHGNVCARTGNELLKAFRQLGTKAKDIRLPVYIGHGTNDRCTSLPASRRFIQNVASKDATLHEFEGGYHELLHGPEWQDATDQMVQWMHQRSKRILSKM